MKKITQFLAALLPVVALVIFQNGIFAQADMQAKTDSYAKSVSNALQFDGFTNYVSIPNGTGIIANLSAFSMCGWVYPNNANAFWPDLDGYFGIKNEGVCDFYIVQLNGTDLEVRITTDQGQFTIPSTSMPQVQVGEWQHFAIVYTGSELQLFYNGVLSGSVAATGTITYNNLEMTIGMLDYFDTDFFLNGKVDEVTFWDVALTADDILENECISGDPSNTPNLLAYYDFNQTEGLVLPDYFGNYGGTLTNMTGNEWVESEVCQSGYDIQFSVTNELTGNPVENAAINLDGTVKNTDVNGEVTFNNYDPGDYPFEITKSAYYPQTGNITLIDNDTLIEILLAPVVYYTITFNVTGDPGGAPVDSALVNVDGFIQYTNTSGQTTFTGFLPGDYPYAIFKDDFGIVEDTAHVINEDLSIDISLIMSGINQSRSGRFNIFPNPVDDEIKLTLKERDTGESTLTLLSITGSIIKSLTCQDQNPLQLDVGELPSGIYLIKVENPEWVEVKKILVR